MEVHTAIAKGDHLEIRSKEEIRDHHLMSDRLSRIFFPIICFLAAATWVSLHLIHYPCRKLHVIHRHGTNRTSVILRQHWRVLQFVQKALLVAGYALVVTALLLSDPGQAMLSLAGAVIVAGACPDHWRRSGTIYPNYFEAVVVTACCSGVYTSAQGMLHHSVPVIDTALISCLPLVVLLHSVLVLRARRTHMPLTATAPIGILAQFLAPGRDLDSRINNALESFHAVGNINRIERALERVGSGVALALYDSVSHGLAGLLIVATGCACLRTKWMLADERRSDTLRFAVLSWVLYGGLLWTQAAVVSGVYLYYTRSLRRSNPFTPREATIFTKWWNGGALAHISHRAGRWRNFAEGKDPPLGAIIPLMPNSAQAAVGLTALLQPWIDHFMGATGSSLRRLLGASIHGSITDSHTRDRAITDWCIKGYSNAEERSQLATLLRNIIILLDTEPEASDINHRLFNLVSGKVNSIGKWASYVLICSAKRAEWLEPFMDAIVIALECHNHQEYKKTFELGGDTSEQFQLFGKGGMLRRVIAYVVCVAGVSGSWDITEKDYLHIATVQSIAVVLHLHTDFGSLQALVGRVEEDMVAVFGPGKAMRDDNIQLSTTRAVIPTTLHTPFHPAACSSFLRRTLSSQHKTAPCEP